VQILDVILAFALLGLVLFVVSAPLRAGGEQGSAQADVSSPRRAELEAAREAKYREIRDAELDLRTGKLSQEDYDAIDGALRAEAVEILDRLQELQGAADDQQSGQLQQQAGRAPHGGSEAHDAPDGDGRMEPR
jgi:hypothetical protein